MQPLAFIPKDDDRLPDCYGLKLFYIDGKMEEFEIGHHRLGDKVLEFVTHEHELWHWVQMNNVKRVEFDKRFSKIVALKVERETANKK